MDHFLANDCALVAHSHNRIQEITSCFATACKNFTLTIITKTEDLSTNPHLLQSTSTHNHRPEESQPSGELHLSWRNYQG
ncbi:hypothetical protein HOLleu_14055 [Holothuria leucospilota]|uniref:Uncharacterized protein n=1 Tax=Holothuria leucospilota TaxID=206669 RepID=A0A9Q1C8B8_HOLLE|nr:hypothetical protein HOLleu_14055 [Holothuria leucospilota]